MTKQLGIGCRALVAVVLVLAVSASLTGGEEPTAPRAAAAPREAPVEEERPEPMKPVELAGPLAIGETAQVGDHYRQRGVAHHARCAARSPDPVVPRGTNRGEDATITLQGVRRVDEDEFGRLITLAEFHIQNTGDELYNLSMLIQFAACDANKRTHNPTFSTETFSTEGRGSLDAQLQPGQEIVGEVAFELPPDAAPYTIRFTRAIGTDFAEWYVPAEAIR